MADGDTWFSTFEPELQTFVTAKGFDKLDRDAALAAAIKGHQNAEKLIGSTPRLPKDLTDPNYQAAYDHIFGLAAPKTPEEYTFDGVKFKDGGDLDAEDVAFIRNLASSQKLTLAQTRALASALAERADAASDTDSNNRATSMAANQVALRTHWGGHYDAKAFAATKVAEAVGLTPDVLEYMAALPPDQYVKNMEALASLSSQLNEATILRGGAPPPRDPTAGFTPDQARTELTRLQNDPVWRGKVLARDAEASKTWQNLVAIIAEGNVTTGMRR